MDKRSLGVPGATLTAHIVIPSKNIDQTVTTITNNYGDAILEIASPIPFVMEEIVNGMDAYITASAPAIGTGHSIELEQTIAVLSSPAWVRFPAVVLQ